MPKGGGASADMLRRIYCPLEWIVFPLHGLTDGSSTSIAMVGNEVVIGIALPMGE